MREKGEERRREGEKEREERREERGERERELNTLMQTDFKNAERLMKKENATKNYSHIQREREEIKILKA